MMITKVRSNKLFKTLGNIVFLVIYKYVADLLAYIFYDIEFAWSFSPRHYFESIITVLIVLELTRVVGKYVDGRFAWTEKTGIRFIFLSVLALALSGLVTLIVIVLVSLINNNSEMAQMELPFNILNNWGLCFMILAYDLISSLLNRWRESILEVERFKKESIEFRFETLKNQVNPHFLFNSLNTLSSLMHLDIDAADRYIRQLARVYRYVLENREKELISLETELKILQSYMYLVQMRFKDKLNFRIDLPNQLSAYGIPPMTLQMLIENAIKHNEISKTHPLTIDIYLEGEDYLAVKNEVKLKSSKEYSSKVGLDNIISRYRYLSDKDIKVENTHGVFTVSIPLLKPEQPNRL